MAPRTHGRLLLACAALGLATAAAAQDRKPLTLDALYDPEKKADFSGAAPRDVTWIDDARYHWTRTDPTTRHAEHFVGDADTGASRPLFDAAWLARELARAGVSAADAERAARRRTQAMDKAKTQMVVAAGAISSACSSTPRASPASPAGRARTRSRRSAPTAAGWPSCASTTSTWWTPPPAARRRLTTDGSPDVLNGKLDWVYQEEIYGRGNCSQAHWWSPDSQPPSPSCASTRRASRATRWWTTSTSRPTSRSPTTRAPASATRACAWARSPRAEAPRGGSTSRNTRPRSPWSWTSAGRPDGRLAFQVQDREQTWLDLRLAERSGVSRRVLRETTPRLGRAPRRRAALAGRRHLPLAQRARRVEAPLPPAPRRHGGRPRHLRRVGGPHAARRGREGAGGVLLRHRARPHRPRRLPRRGSTAAGSRASPRVRARTPPPSRRRWRATSTPGATCARRTRRGCTRADGERAAGDRRAGRSPPWPNTGYTAPEFLQVKTRDGFVMEAMMIKPPGFDPARRYPVYQQTYGGPHAQRVRDAWGDVAPHVPAAGRPAAA